MVCNQCGAKNVQHARFCIACGVSLEVNSTTGSSRRTYRIDTGKLIIDNRFQVLENLGKGGMGEIFLAEDVKLKRKVAIKSILKSALADPSAKARFLREAQTASQLDHPNICTIYGIYDEDERDFIVMQYIDGVTLNHIIELKKLDIDQVLDIAGQVCSGMIEANNKEIIHRDLKPANIMVDNKGIVKVLDFGLAKFTDRSMVKEDGMVDSNLTEQGIVMGTVSYISPEQARGQALDRRTDIFSFGIILYEMLEDRNPFLDDEQISTLYNVINKEVTFTRDIPAELKSIVMKCLEKNRNRRYHDFAALKADLDAFKNSYALAGVAGVAGVAGEGIGERGSTEKIDAKEHAQLLQGTELATVQTSKEENLGDMVYRIKKFKAFTEPVITTRKSKVKYFALPVIAVLIAILALVLVKHKNSHPLVTHDQKFYIYIHQFENKTREKDLESKITYLLKESLDQFDRFKAITADALPGGDSLQQSGGYPAALQQLKEKFNIEYELRGTLSEDRGFYTIAAELVSFEGGKGPAVSTDAQANPQLSPVKEIIKPITATGQGLDSFLTIQVDMVTGRVYSILFSNKEKQREIKKIAGIFGTDWQKFCAYYLGLGYLKRLESSKAEKYLLQALDVPVTRFSLAQVYDFKGDRGKAMTKIIELAPFMDSLTAPIAYRVQALQARLRFDFAEEVNNLEKLKDSYPFYKEVFFDMGEAYLQHRDPLRAIPYYEQALQLDALYSKAINHLAYCYSYTGEHDRAIQLFEEYNNLDQTANSFDSLGDGYFYKGDLAFAEQFKRNAIRMDEAGVPYSFTTLADIYILQARYDKAREALQDYQRVKNDDISRARVLAVQAFMLYHNRQYQQALETIDRSLAVFDSDDIKNDSTEAHWLRGMICLVPGIRFSPGPSGSNQDGKEKAQPVEPGEQAGLPEARKDLEWLSRFKDKYNLSPGNFSVGYKYWLHLQALILEKEGKRKEAADLFKALLGMKEKLSFWTYYNYQFFHTEYARFLFRAGEYDAALQEIGQCLQFSANYLPALWLKAEILEKLVTKDAKLRQEIDLVYRKIKELMGESEESNYRRDILKQKMVNR